jgi:hypothetical protein
MTYKTQSSQLNSICNLDEDDLNFDLDDDSNECSVKRTLSTTSFNLDSQQTRVSTTEQQFKKPKLDSVLNAFSQAGKSNVDFLAFDEKSQRHRENNRNGRHDNFASSTQIYDAASSQYETLETSKNESTIIDSFVDQQGANEKIWSFAKEDLIDRCHKMNIDQIVLFKYSLKNYMVKVGL